ncbi:pyruvate kinase [Hyphomicrobium sp.]|uniref:pyruvate kinase n=1 Tax=Hyphomicrobium sp. TaxID=82 RepID=UPI002D15A729|nr:pyruvate kinase [Hyphomicrobium sp.]HRQ27531.1 pyruvate kinase [Hyphomicrobium sp.]
MRRDRRVKIVATLGPASSAPDVIERLFVAGVDVFRVNMSHTGHDAARGLVRTIRDVSDKHRCSIGVLCDLQGPKFRLGEFVDGRTLVKAGELFRFDQSGEPGTSQRVSLPHPPIFDAVKPGDALLIDDGKLRMRVIESGKGDIVAEVVTGGIMSNRKGLSLPDTVLAVSPLTEKDREDLDLALKVGADWIALSFVQRAEDVIEAKRIIDGRAAVLAKIEKPSAIEEIDDIIAAGDGFMVARGDLGVEMPVERVPGLQKKITRKARSAGKPIVVATQMLESMTSSPMPTRAEVSDVATAVFDGADAIMLSGESAVGQYPVETIQMMNRIAREVEHDPSYDTLVHAIDLPPVPTGADAIAVAAHAISGTVQVAAILCYTATGSTALRVARERPNLPVIGLTPIARTAQRLTLVWGIETVLTGDPEDLADMVRKATRIAYEGNFVKPGQGVVITCGVPLGSPGATNMIRLAFVDEHGLPDGHVPEYVPVGGKVPVDKRPPPKLAS